MDYEKKYKEALEGAKTLYENANGMILKKWVEQVFPELKESEDEKIMKCVKYAIDKLFLKEKIVCDVHKEDVLNWLEKQGNQELADKIEPKFHEGDWVVCEFTDSFFQIKNCIENLITHKYGYDLTNGGYISSVGASHFHLWTIQDAKDGDVLVEDSCIFIIQKLGDNSTAAKTYFTLYNDGDFDDGSILYFDIDSTKPATKEQRDLLFQKMKEAGYEWDAEKKELKKIDARENLTLDEDLMEADCMIVEQTYAWSEEDKKMINDIIDYIKPMPIFFESTKGKSGKEYTEEFVKNAIKWLKSLKDRVQPKVESIKT